MTKLEQEIYQSLLVHEGIEGVEDGNPISAGICESHAKAAAEVAKKYIEGALESCAVLTYMQRQHGNWPRIKEKWLKENGVTE